MARWTYQFNPKKGETTVCLTGSTAKPLVFKGQFNDAYQVGSLWGEVKLFTREGETLRYYHSPGHLVHDPVKGVIAGVVQPTRPVLKDGRHDQGYDKPKYKGILANVLVRTGEDGTTRLMSELEEAVNDFNRGEGERTSRALAAQVDKEIMSKEWDLGPGYTPKELADKLGVPENRVRAHAGMPLVSQDMVSLRERFRLSGVSPHDALIIERVVEKVKGLHRNAVDAESISMQTGVAKWMIDIYWKHIDPFLVPTYVPRDCVPITEEVETARNKLTGRPYPLSWQAISHITGMPLERIRENFTKLKPWSGEGTLVPDNMVAARVKGETLKGYHKADIPQGTYGEFSKVEEEFHEAKDAFDQGNKVMLAVELSDIILAIKGFVNKHIPGVSLEDLVSQAEATERAFASGQRRSKRAHPPVSDQ